MWTSRMWRASTAIAIFAIGFAHAARAEWTKAYRDNFVNGCINAVGDAQKAAHGCACMAREMEAQVSQDRMIELSRMPNGQERSAALTPLLQTAKAKCDDHTNSR